jgi:hypothetical protein
MDEKGLGRRPDGEASAECFACWEVSPDDLKAKGGKLRSNSHTMSTESPV